MTESVLDPQGFFGFPVGTASLLFVAGLGLGPALPDAKHRLESHDSPTVAVHYRGERAFESTSYRMTNWTEEKVVSAKLQTVQRFATQLLDRIQDMDPEYQKLVNEHFWDLV